MKYGLFLAVILGVALMLPTVMATEYETVTLFNEDFDEQDEVDFDDNWDSDNEDLYDVVGADDYMILSSYNYSEEEYIETQAKFEYDVVTIEFDVAFEVDDVNYSGFFYPISSDETPWMLVWNDETMTFHYDMEDEFLSIDTDVTFDDSREWMTVKIVYDRAEELLYLEVRDGSVVEYDEEFEDVGELDEEYGLAYGLACNFPDDVNATFVEDTGKFYLDEITVTTEEEIVRSSTTQFLIDYWYVILIVGIGMLVGAYAIADDETDIESFLYGTGGASILFGIFLWLFPSIAQNFWMWFIFYATLIVGGNAFAGHYLMHDWEDYRFERLFVTSFKAIFVVLLVLDVILYYIYFL